MNKQFGYTMPHPPEGVQPADLMSTTTSGPVKEPADEEKVLCINRGRRPLVDTFDARHVEMPAGFFYIEYGAAKHFQRRLIVPGSKNLADGGYVSWIGICGVNHADQCEPFTDEELERFNESIEAIDRSQDYGLGKEVKPVRTNAIRASSPSLGVQRGPGSKVGIDVSAQASPEATAAAAAVLEPPADNDAREEAAEARAERPPVAGRRR